MKRIASSSMTGSRVQVRYHFCGVLTWSNIQPNILSPGADCKWLVVYDNVESADTLTPYWPRATNQGRAIITTRNHSLAFDPAESGLEITSWDADTGAEFLLFLLKNSIGRDLNSESISARTLSEKLSGHALALSQMAGLIHDGELSIKEFTTMFIKNPQSAHAVNGLSELWQFAFESLDVNSSSLLGIISFLQPDHIPPGIFRPGDKLDLPLWASVSLTSSRVQRI